jgi:hypothetical protein
VPAIDGYTGHIIDGDRTMAMRISVVTAIIGLLLASAATTQAADRTGWGVSATVGTSKIEDKDGADTFGGNGFGVSAEIEYRFTPNFALGFGVFSLGNAEDTFNSVETQIEVRGLDLFGRAILPVSDSVDVFARVGSANYFVDIEPGSVSFLDGLFGKEAVELGLGVDFGRREKIGIRLEGRFFNGGSDETGALLMVGVNYLF